MICSLASYREITGDNDTYDGYVLDALVKAQKLFEQKTHRKFEYATYTELLARYPDARVYPSATPLSAVQDPSGSYIDGNAVWSGGFLPFDALVNWNGFYTDNPLAYKQKVQITYTGGYTDDEMPVDVINAVARLAESTMLSETIEIPAGVTSISMGGQTYSGQNLGNVSQSEIPPVVREAIRVWKRKDL